MTNETLRKIEVTKPQAVITRSELNASKWDDGGIPRVSQNRKQSSQGLSEQLLKDIQLGEEYTVTKPQAVITRSEQGRVGFIKGYFLTMSQNRKRSSQGLRIMRDVNIAVTEDAWSQNRKRSSQGLRVELETRTTGG